MTEPLAAGVCRTCEAPIVWAKSEATGRAMPIDAVPVEGIIRLVDMPEDFSGPVNLGNPSEISVKELATQIVEACESDSEIRFLGLPQDDPTQRCPDITLAKTALKWAPEVSLDTGLRKTIEWFRNNLSDFGRE